jgi:hypothetical protein
MKTDLRTLFLSFAFALAGVLLLSTAPLSAQKKDKKPPKEAPQSPKTEPKRILLFPTDYQEGSKAIALTDAVERSITRRLSEKDQYAVTAFFPAMSLIKRAVIQRQIEKKDVEHPYDKTDKAKKLADIAGYNLVVLSSINDYQFDATKKQVTLDISIRIVDFAGEKPAVITFVAETATSPTSTDANATEEKIALDFARDFIEKLMKDVLKPKATEKPKEAEKKPE